MWADHCTPINVLHIFTCCPIVNEGLITLAANERVKFIQIILATSFCKNQEISFEFQMGFEGLRDICVRDAELQRCSACRTGNKVETNLRSRPSSLRHCK